MHTGRSYGILEFLDWTRREIYVLTLVATVPVTLYEVLDIKWLVVPWVVVAVLGTATAFIVGFKNLQTYNRAWEARQIWGEISGASRAWAAMCRDYARDPAEAKLFVYRHFAWLTALRYALREPRPWETANGAANEEYRLRRFSVPEREKSLEDSLAAYLPASELAPTLASHNRAAHLMSIQSQRAAMLYGRGAIAVVQFADMQRSIRELALLQGRSERIKNFPYPRQFATVSGVFVKLFCLTLPFGLLREFDKLNDGLAGAMQGNMAWLAIPSSVVISWVFTSLDQVGESTQNPFEGGANDVPITRLSREIEIDLREMLGETALPPAIEPMNRIVL